MFLLFAGNLYYPGGGWNDFRGSFAIIEQARVYARDYDWFHIVYDGEIVESGGRNS
jgi:hypothetical protein